MIKLDFFNWNYLLVLSFEVTTYLESSALLNSFSLASSKVTSLPLTSKSNLGASYLHDGHQAICPPAEEEVVQGARDGSVGESPRPGHQREPGELHLTKTNLVRADQRWKVTFWKESWSTSCSLKPEKILRFLFSTSSERKNSPIVQP